METAQALIHLNEKLQGILRSEANDKKTTTTHSSKTSTQPKCSVVKANASDRQVKFTHASKLITFNPVVKRYIYPLNEKMARRNAINLAKIRTLSNEVETELQPSGEQFCFMLSTKCI